MVVKDRFISNWHNNLKNTEIKPRAKNLSNDKEIL